MMVTNIIGSIVLIFGVIGLFQIFRDARTGTARVPPMSLWRTRDPVEIEKTDSPISFWAAIFGRGFFWLALVIFGLTLLWQGLSL